MTPEELSTQLVAALRQAVNDGVVALDPALIPDQVHLERSRQAGFGDWATNLAMQFAVKAGTNPRRLATCLLDYINGIDGVEKAEVAGPGFVNITLAKAAAGALAAQIVQQGPKFGAGQALAGQTINVEFVSANPTGPIHLAGARWAAVGDSLARLFQNQGAKVVREYYFNDHGSQIDRFSQSIWNVTQGLPVPDDGYGGLYINDLAAEIAAQNPGLAQLPEDQAKETIRQGGTDLMFAHIKQSLHQFGVDFDVYFHEQDLHQTGAVQAAMDELVAAGTIYHQDGAWWLKSSQFGDDKDRVVIKSDGQPAYIAADIAYFRDKRQRGADLAIYLLGADHHGYVARLKAAAAALGDNPDRAEVLIGQMVFLVENGSVVKMSKRAGTVVTMDDLVDAIGVDGARYAMARSSIDSNLEIDLDIWRQQSNDNPVFYVQYAHARTKAVARNAAAAGLTQSAQDLATLDHATESALLSLLADFPRVLTQAAQLREVHRVARYLEKLASAYHKWYDQRRVIPPADQSIEPLHRARLLLNNATGQVLANGLALLGVAAPERM